MNELDVRIVELEPLLVASAHGFGSQPEPVAIEKLLAWAKKNGLLDSPDKVRVFGFNNPCPSAGSPNYGYEAWMVVSPEAQPEDEIKIKAFAGGLYAVARCQGPDNLPSTWQRLATWRETSPYREAHHQWLEEHLTFIDVPPEEMVFDIYVPLKK